MTITFKPGQVWRYLTRPHEAESVLCVIAVTEHPKLGTVCSVALVGVAIANPRMEGGVQSVLPHAPITAETLEAAVVEHLADDGPLADEPGLDEAYQEWRVVFDAGEAGVFTISPAEILDIIEQTVTD